ncbi:MAG: hypothetical protein HQM04_15075 [Magnetococcales bacterium]|nr:hypothetical protein [Magnetococcales bacterium]MBF0116348.1 hypothetical protein [Magnetococcales bacterium]
MNLSRFLQRIQLRNSFIAVVILVQVLLVLLTVVFIQIAIPILDRAEEEKIRGVVTYVHNEIDQAIHRAEVAITAVADNEHIVQWVAQSDRERLMAEVEKIWNDFRLLGFAQFNFHVKRKEGSEMVFLYRAHNPEKFNDAITFRPTVMKANASKQLVKGLEQGRAGYGFRAVAPLFLQGVHIGSAEIGFDMANAFLEILNSHYPGNWAIYNLARGISEGDDKVLLNAVGRQKDKVFENLLPDESIQNRIKGDKHHYQMDESTKSVNLYIPVKNYQGDIVLMVQYVSATDYFDKLNQAKQGTILICGTGLIISGIIIFILYKMITTPIRQLVIETENIKRFQIDEPLQIRSQIGEVQELVDAMEGMKIGLQSFRKYIPDQLVRQLILSRQEAVVSGSRRHLTIFFSDIADFSAISERLTPNELASQLSEYMSEMTDIISAHGGTVDKYIGDSIMAFWGAPLEMQDHAHQACLAALACNRRLDELASKWQQERKPAFRTRMGINTGEVVVGNIGSDTRLNYTVIGDAVNLASRLEGLNKEYDTSIIISQSTLEELPHDYAYRLLDIVVVKGKLEPVPIYELAALKGDITLIDSEFMEIFSKAVEFYVVKDWHRARNRFVRLLEIKPGDRACEMFIERCNIYEQDPPGIDWGGEYVYHRK